MTLRDPDNYRAVNGDEGGTWRPVAFEGFVEQHRREGIKIVELSRENLKLANASGFLALHPAVFGGAVALTPVKGTVQSGKAGVVTIRGPLAQRAVDGMCAYVDGYDAIAERFAAAHENRDIDAVILDVDSPGGDVAGLDQCVAAMNRATAKSGKPVFVYVNESAYSAMYNIAASVSTDGISLPPSGSVGSIGVISGYVDETGMLEKEGVKVHLVRWPEGKAESHSFAPLSELAQSRINTRVRAKGETFIGQMAKARGLTADAVRDFNGDTFDGEAAVKAGLADRVEDFESVVARAQAAGQKWRRTMEKAQMDQVKFDSLQAFQSKVLGILGAKDESSALGMLTAAKQALDDAPELNAKVSANEINVAALQKQNDDRDAKVMIDGARALNKIVPANLTKAQAIYAEHGLKVLTAHIDALVPVTPSAAAVGGEQKPDTKTPQQHADAAGAAPGAPAVKYENMKPKGRADYAFAHGTPAYEALKQDWIDRGSPAAT